MIAESQRWFLGLVETRRGIETANVPGLEQGRVFPGREALAIKLVDEIGGEAEAVEWLEEKRNVAKGLKVVDWKPKRESSWGLLGLSSRRSGGSSASVPAGAIGQLLDADDAFGGLALTASFPFGTLRKNETIQ